MVTLFDHQKEALEKLHNGSILYGGVGSGKSITGLAYFMKSQVYSQDAKKPDLYIITTARKRDTLEWDKECARFALSQDPDRSLYNIKVTIDSWNNIGKYVKVKNCFFIFDEQRLVGYGAWVKSFLKIVRNSNEWILLSATPGDSWMDYIPVFIANGFYANKTEFVRRHVIYNRFTKYPCVSRFVEEKRLRRLRDSILVAMNFNRDTVPHHEKIIIPYNKEMYDFVMRQRWNVYKDRPVKEASELCQTLRHIVNSDPGRLETIEWIMETHPRVIIFYNYDYELELLKKLSCPNITEWNGHKHEPISGGDSWVYLVQYTAGAEGWNCIETNTIIFYSQSYSYKQMVQAAGRIDRLNTPFKDLYYYHLTSTSKIDLAITRALKNKQNFNENAFAKE